jgi:hypothetical protein
VSLPKARCLHFWTPVTRKTNGGRLATWTSRPASAAASGRGTRLAEEHQEILDRDAQFDLAALKSRRSARTRFATQTEDSRRRASIGNSPGTAHTRRELGEPNRDESRRGFR